MDYEKKDFRKLYEDLVKSDWFKRAYHNKSLGEYPFDIPELAESEDERIIGNIKKAVESYWSDESLDEILFWLERQKECLVGNSKTSADKDERIRMYFIWIVKNVLNNIQGLKLSKEQTIELIDNYSGIKESDMIAYLEKQKEQKPNVLQNAFDKSKKDYTLEEKSKASDYAESILPTSVMYGESEEEYKLHTIIEAAFIAGQKEQKPIPANSVGLKEQKPAWSVNDEKNLKSVISTLWFALNTPHFPLNYERIIELEGWLKSLRPPFKDKEMKLKILKYLSTRCSSLEFEEVEDYLNNLRPSWKPSEEQIKAIKHAYNSFPNDCSTKLNLRLLYHDLQKLI